MDKKTWQYQKRYVHDRTQCIICGKYLRENGYDGVDSVDYQNLEYTKNGKYRSFFHTSCMFPKGVSKCE